MPVNVPWALVPEQSPSVPGAIQETASVLSDALQRRAFLWTTALVDHALARPDLRRAALRHRPETSFWMAAGFVAVPRGMGVPRDVARQDGFFFGLCVFPAAVPGRSPEFLESLQVGERRFPILSLPAYFLRHCPIGGPPDPRGARSGAAACWAEPTPGGVNPTNLQGSGILTAAHVAIDAMAVAPMAPPTPHGVVGYAIDAAVLYPAPRPPEANPLRVRAAAAVGAQVNVYPQAGGARAATILLAFQPSAFVGVLCPHRLIIDLPFAPGDSGALVKDRATSEALGIYIGAIAAQGGPNRGACQIMQQVVTELAIDLYL
ncbi:MAG: hypothetical protein ACREFP_07640 [Acetobacteraceae bacterium]